MEFHLKPHNTHFSSIIVKSSNKTSLQKTTRPSSSSSSSSNLQFHKLSQKELSKILRTDAAIEAIERKANSSKYKNLQTKPVLEALDHAIKENRWESALKIFGLLRKQNWYDPRCQTYAKLLVMLGKCKQPNQASLLFEIMLSDGLRPTVEIYTAIVGAYAANGLFDKAFSTLDCMKSVTNCEPDAFTYSTLIKYCIKFHHFDMIRLIIKEMVNSRIECTTVTYNILVDGYGKALRFDLMEDSLNEMIQSEDSQPDIFTFNSVIGAYGGCGRIKEMEKWFHEFQVMGLKPDITTYNVLINSYGKSCLFVKMRNVMEFMRKRFYSPTVVTYNIIIEAFGKAGDIEKMDKYFLRMKHEGIKPNSITYSSLIHAYGKKGRMGKINSVLKQVANSDVVLDTAFFNCAISAYGNAGDLEQMMEIFIAMEGRGCKPDKSTFSTMSRAYRAQGMIEVAQSLENNLVNAKNSACSSSIVSIHKKE